MRVPASSSGWPVRDVGFPAFVLDEATERFWWDTATYFLPGPHPPRGERWWFAFRADLAGLAAQGIRGLRLNLYSPTRGAYANDSLTESFAAASRVAQAMGWHVQVIAGLPMLLEPAQEA